jgi:chromosomal replication initiation ATPase DnaA
LFQIGQHLGGYDHSTIMFSVAKITGLLETDEALADEIAQLRELITPTHDPRQMALAL